MARPALTAIVTTLNEEVNLRGCLESLAFVDSILLVDSFSTDRTLEIARSFPSVEAVQREYFGSAAQKNWAMDRVTTPWLLIVDADERVPPDLAREILELLEKGPDAQAYFIRRENVFLDRIIRHSGWSTDKVVRLMERGAARYPNRRVHADLDPPGATPTLRSPMVHYTCRSLSQYVDKLNRYADLGSRRSLPGRTSRGRGRAPAAAVLAIFPDVRDPGRLSRRPTRTRGVRPSGVECLSQVGPGLGVGPLSTEWMAGRPSGIR